MDSDRSTEKQFPPVPPADSAPGPDANPDQAPGKIEVYERPRFPLLAQPGRLALLIVVLLVMAVLVLWFLWYAVL
ncbi:MAG: hypothetical protein KC441_19680 [Anaerolineales bacterium]|nr:hypothetical protein [Anaerolineales bacterium]